MSLDSKSAAIVALGSINGGSSSIAYGVSALGDVIAGTANDGAAGNAQRAFRWTQGGGMISLGTLNGGLRSYGLAIDASGNVIVGNADDGAAGGANRAFVWTQSTGMVSLGTLAGGTSSNANALSRSGAVVVGSADDGLGNHAFRWTTSGMETIEQWLASAGVPVSSNVETLLATAVNADGSVVAGLLANGDPFVARVSTTSPSGGSGLINLDEYVQTLSQSAQTRTAMPLQQADLVVHGAHGAPMQAPLGAGRSSFWAAGDLGASDRPDATNYSEGLAEIGYAYGIDGRTQIKVALGHTSSRQSLPVEGSARARGTYVVPELIWQAAPALFATFTGYYNDGDVHVRRGYVNAGSPDMSSGDLDSKTLGLRVRLDALNLWRVRDFDFTPYVSLTYSRTKAGEMTETGGGFPVRWDARTDSEQVGRIGLDVTRVLEGGVHLTGRVELAHRLSGNSRGATGDVIGIMPFQTAAPDTTDSWMRVGAGIDLPLGPGRFATTLNATSRGGAPAYWLATSYRVGF